jgi:26S proteasome regulatory subunit N10
MICLDNSEYMRNGDYSPTRLAAQTETINYLTEAKLRNHQDSTVGLLAMAGKRIEVHVAPCRSPGKIVKALTKEVKIGGKSDVLGALKTAQLALKNRQNKNLRQRIILFVGSPIEDDIKQFIKLGKVFKKNNVAVDVINFGEENGSNENMEKLEAFVNAVKNGDNSHFLTVPPGPHDLSDLVLTSGVMHGASGGGFGGLNNLGDLGVIPANLGGPPAGANTGTGGGGTGTGSGGTGAGAPLVGADGFPVDPNVDPETYLALKASLEEYQRQQKLAKDKETKKDAPAPSTAASTTAKTSSSSSSASSSSSTSSTTSSSSGETPMDTGDEDEEPEDEAEALLLAQALQMSIGTEEESSDNKSSPSTTTPPATTTTATPSAPEASKAEKKAGEEEEPDLTLALSDPNFLSSLLESVPGVNKDQISMDSILEGLTGGTTTPATPEETQGKKTKKKKGAPKKGGKKRKENPK